MSTITEQLSGMITEQLSDWVTSLPHVGGRTPQDSSQGADDYTDLIWQAGESGAGGGGVQTSGMSSFLGWRGYLNQNTKVEHDRKSRYRDYDMMSTDPIIEPSMELYVDEAFDQNLDNNRKIWPTTNDKNMEDMPDEISKPEDLNKDLEEFLYEIINIESNIHDWGYEVAQRGDFFVRNRIEPGEGIYYVEDDLHPSDIRRIEINGQLVGFSSRAIKNYLTGTGSGSEKGLFEPQEFVHFRLFGPNRRRPLEERDNIVTVKNDEGEQFRVTAKYGWCVAEGERVWTAGGHVPVEDVEVGDDVVVTDPDTLETEVTRVLDRVCNGEKDVYEVQTKHRSIRLTEEHPVLRVNSDDGNEWVTVGDLNEGDSIAINTEDRVKGDEQSIEWPDQLTSYKTPSDEKYVVLTDSGKEKFRESEVNHQEIAEFIGDVSRQTISDRIRQKYAMPHSQLVSMAECAGVSITDDDWSLKRSDRFSVSEFPKSTTPEFCRWFGFMLGDGWINEGANEVAMAESSDSEMNDRYKSLFESLFGLDLRRCNPEGRDSDFGYYKVGSVELTGMLENMGWINGSHEKRIPNWVYSLPIKHKREFISGFIDADGWKTDQQSEMHHIELCNEPLIKDLKSLIDGVGFACGNIKSREARTSKKENGDVIKSEGTYTISFRLEELKDQVETVKFIEFDGSEKVYDLEVESDNHNFTVNGVVVHNSILEPARKVFKEWRLLKDSLILARVTRSARKNVVGIDVGNMPPSEAVDVVNRYQELVSSTKAVDVDEGELEERVDPGEYNDWIFIPLRGQVQDLSVQELGGDVDIKGIEDIKEKRRQLFGSLKVSPSMLGHEVESQGNLSQDTSLKRQSIRFAKQARRLQQSVIVGIKQLCLIHLHAKYQQPINPRAFDIKSSWTSTAEQVERSQAMSDKFQFVNDMIQMIQNVAGRGGRGDEDAFSPNKKYIVAWAFEFMDIPDFDVEKALGISKEEAEEEATEEEKQIAEEVAKEMRERDTDISSRDRAVDLAGDYTNEKQKNRERFGEGIEVVNGESKETGEEPEGSVVQ